MITLTTIGLLLAAFWQQWVCPPCRNGDHDNCCGGPCSCGC